MIVSIKLDNNLSCDLLCKKVQDAINNYVKEFNDTTDTVVVIDIKKTTENISLIPKIEYKADTT